MFIATWNVNSIGVRLEHVVDWLQRVRPSVLCLQETKTIDEKFPREAFANCGYESFYFGEKSYNGVAIITNLPIENLQKGFIHEGPSDSKRFITATIAGIEILNCYIPNGQAVGSEKYRYKLAWMTSLRDHLSSLKNREQVLLCGDFNVAPQDMDVHDPVAYGEEIMCSPEERSMLQSIMELGLIDAFRLHSPDAGHYSWWDYRAAAFRRNLGFRIDHIWVTEKLASRCQNVWIDKEPRKLERPSDHAPVVAQFGD